MARLPNIDPTKHPELAELAAQIGKERGRVSHLYGTLLNSPPVAAGWLHLLTAVRQHTKLKGSWRELVILRVALVNGADYEYRSHVPHALQEGVTQAQIDGLPQWELSDAFDKQTRAVLAYSDAMTREIKVPDALFAAIREFLDDREIMDLTALVGSYNLVSRVLIALQIGH